MRSVGTALVKLIATATSGLVSFTTNVIRPVKVTCKFSPVQEGTGDPSPDNVRPISGWNGCELFSSNGNRLLASSDEFYPTFIRKGTTITASIKDEGQNTQARFYSKDRTFIDYWTMTMTDNGRRYRSFTVHEDVYYFNFGPTPQDVCVREGNNNYDFLPHATSVPISWQTEAGTVYGGTVTLNEDGSADLVATHRLITYDGSENWQAGTLKNSVYGSYIRNTEIGTIWGASPVVAWSNMAVQSTKAYTQSSANNICSTGGWLYYTVDSSVATNVEELKTFLSSNNLQVVYPLKDSQTYHFDNIGQLQSFLGTNNIWHNMNGSITAEYYKKQ